MPKPLFVVWCLIPAKGTVPERWQRVTLPMLWEDACRSTGDIIFQHVRIVPDGTHPGQQK